MKDKDPRQSANWVKLAYYYKVDIISKDTPKWLLQFLQLEAYCNVRNLVQVRECLNGWLVIDDGIKDIKGVKFKSYNLPLIGYAEFPKYDNTRLVTNKTYNGLAQVEIPNISSLPRRSGTGDDFDTLVLLLNI